MVASAARAARAHAFSAPRSSRSGFRSAGTVSTAPASRQATALPVLDQTIRYSSFVIWPRLSLPHYCLLNTIVAVIGSAPAVLGLGAFSAGFKARCSRPDLVETLKEATKGSGPSASGGKTRRLLVVVEVALSVVLLVGASLAIRGFVNLQHTDVGFQPDRVLMVGLQLAPKRYATYEQRIAFTQNVLERVRSIPGAQSAAIGNGGLPCGGQQSGFSIEGLAQTTQRMTVSLVSADYPQTLGIPLQAGRGLNNQEVARGEHVVLINTAAAKLWPPGENPIGRRVRLDVLENPRGALVPQVASAPYVTVVGILADTRNAGRSEEHTSE